MDFACVAQIFVHRPCVSSIKPAKSSALYPKIESNLKLLIDSRFTGAALPPISCLVVDPIPTDCTTEPLPATSKKRAIQPLRLSFSP